MPVERLTFIKDNLKRIGFDLSKQYDELIKESYINEVVFSNIANDKYVRFGFVYLFEFN
jgi:hypothetical protein